ncbi:long-chain fatty acid--CoA ligase [Hydrogenophaga sp. 5NK40-0174]|uniref:class I adenylate-forming enzyme family protein n=1 Tax=Hydrogenophaga sp. 5NK40-0174 TaxID=3127649 RepID=UPI003106ECF0
MATGGIQNRILRWVLDQLRTARTVARLAYRLYGKRTALIDRRGAWTYRQLQDRVLRLNAWMETEAGVRHGDIVFTWLPETGEQYEVRLATYENGAKLAMFHQFLSAQGVLAMLEELRPGVFIHDPALTANILPTIIERFPDMRLLAIGQEYEAALARHKPRQGTTPVNEDDVFSLHMTSGTTGLPKTIGYSHRKYLDSIRLMARSLDFSKPAKGADVNMIGLPMTGPGSGMVLPTLLAGAAMVMPEDFRAETLLQLIETHRVTRAYFSPSGLVDLVDMPGVRDYDLSSLRLIAYGSEMMPAPKLHEAIELLGPILQQGYGCFEALPPITWLMPADHVDSQGKPASHEVLSSVGSITPGVDVVVRDANWNPLPAGQQGQITVRTPVQFNGYWPSRSGMTAKTAETLRDGWVVMGDIGYIDMAGRLHVQGRMADLITRNGLSVAPRQTEEAAHGHPAVKETCFVQVDDRAVLVVSLRRDWQMKDAPAVAQALMQQLRDTLEPSAVPDDIEVVPEIPRSFLNKMLRREVRMMLSPVVHDNENSSSRNSSGSSNNTHHQDQTTVLRTVLT